MYDFHFGAKEDIEKRPEEFLLFCKRLLPRWANGIPDSECLAIFRTLTPLRRKPAVLVETGSGASSLALFLHVALYGGRLFSWDTNASKGAYLRSVISDAICRPLGVDLHKLWTFIGFDSRNPHIGIPVLADLGLKADFGFFDSWHTLDHLMAEVEAFEQVATPTFILALDDAYYRKKHENYSYLNMLRRKIGLPGVNEPADNECQPFYVEVGQYLKKKFRQVKDLDTSYRHEYQDDIFFKYYESDRAAMNSLGMEQREMLEHRFDAWSVA